MMLIQIPVEVLGRAEQQRSDETMQVLDSLRDQLDLERQENQRLRASYRIHPGLLILFFMGMFWLGWLTQVWVGR